MQNTQYSERHGSETKYPYLTLKSGELTYYRIVSGELAGLTVTTCNRESFKAVQLTHDRIEGFKAGAVVGEAVSIDWVVDQFLSSVKVAV